MENNLFVCSSAYQLLNAICITHNYKMQSDLIITRQSLVDCLDIDAIKDSGIFKNVYGWTKLHEYITDEKVSDWRDTILYNFRRLKCMINFSKIQKELPNIEEKYNYVFLGYSDFVSQCIYFGLKKGGSRLALFDEGTFTYGCLVAKEPFLKKMGNRLLYGADLFDDLEAVYVRQPDKMQMGSYSHVNIRTIESCLDEKLKNEILKIYCADEKMTALLDEKVIIFDQNMESDAARQMQKKIVDICCEIISSENVVIKMHPASRTDNYSVTYKKYKDRVPFEVIMETYPMESRMLISVFSTACFAPKLLMNQEPYIVLTYKIMEPYFKFDEHFLHIIDQVKSDYKNEERIFIPSTLEELKKVIYKLKEIL